MGMAASESDTTRSGVWERGGAWVLAQFPLILLALAIARVGPALPSGWLLPARCLGFLLGLAGGLLGLGGSAALGRRLTPFPKPADDTRLVRTGAFGLARHPIYGGGLLGMLAWTLWNGRWAGFLGTAVLLVFFDAKARHEEQWLAEAFPEYPAYRQRVRKLIPFVY
jgi:protein-S-isoprenylcysteine O-methyltransferase Ste14